MIALCFYSDFNIKKSKHKVLHMSSPHESKQWGSFVLFLRFLKMLNCASNRRVDKYISQRKVIINVPDRKPILSMKKKKHWIDLKQTCALPT